MECTKYEHAVYYLWAADNDGEKIHSEICKDKAT